MNGLSQAGNEPSARYPSREPAATASYPQHVAQTRGRAIQPPSAAHLLATLERHIGEGYPSEVARAATLARVASQAGLRDGAFVDFSRPDRHTGYLLYDLLHFEQSGRIYYRYEFGTPEAEAELPTHPITRTWRGKAMLVSRTHSSTMLRTLTPSQVAFAHLDLACVEAEADVLTLLHPRMGLGCTVVVADGDRLLEYVESEENEALWEKRYCVFRLSTGQGLLVRR